MKTQTKPNRDSQNVIGPWPMHDVVVMAVRAAVRAAMTMRMVTSQNLLPIFMAYLLPS